MLPRKCIIYWREFLSMFHILRFPVAVSSKNFFIILATLAPCVTIYVQVHTMVRLLTMEKRENNSITSFSFARYDVISRRSLNLIRDFTRRRREIVRKSMIHQSLQYFLVFYHQPYRHRTCPWKLKQVYKLSIFAVRSHQSRCKWMTGHKVDRFEPVYLLTDLWARGRELNGYLLTKMQQQQQQAMLLLLWMKVEATNREIKKGKKRPVEATANKSKWIHGITNVSIDSL